MQARARLSLIIAMVIYGTIGIFRKYIPLSSASLAMVRGFIGMAFLLILVYAKKSKPSWKAIRANLMVLLISGICIGINWILLFEAYQYTTVAVATLCYYMAPIFVIVASPFVVKEHLTLRKAICVVVALAGMVLVSGVLESGVTGFRGILLGLGAAVLYASVILMNKFIHDINAYDKTIIQLGAAAVVLLPYVLLTENIREIHLTGVALIMVLIVGIIHTGIAYALYFSSMTYLPSQTIALYSYIDPIVAIILSALILHEAMGMMEMIGAVMVLSSTLLSE